MKGCAKIMGQKTILLCDDDQDILDSTSLLLRSAGYDVITAHEHRELTTTLQTVTPDLIVLDVRMPERDGFWIAECLQVLGSRIPILFMSSCDQMIYRLYAPFVGAVEYLIKPVQTDVFLNKIERVLRRSQPQPVHY